MADTKAHILVLDDNEDIQVALSVALTSQGYAVTSFTNAPDAIQALKNSTEPSAALDEKTGGAFDLIISDVCLPKMDGLTFVGEVRKLEMGVPIILMTAFGNLDTAIQAIRLGAFDFLKKPFDVSELILSVERALSHFKLVEENKALSAEITHKWKLDQIIGKSKKMLEVFDLIKRVSVTSANVLITGESGTGKEVVAKAIHQNSLQSGKPFVAINCAAIPEELLESELFGHTKGSFTGAHQARIGLFQEADGGTIFLDEIGDMSVALQAKLLRVLQDRKIKPVGGNAYQQISVRIIAATHRDLKQAIKQEKFREDLYFRLNVISIAVPPLRERQEDIVLLAQHFLRKFSAIHRAAANRFAKASLSYLTSRTWPGNVRELENAIERAVVLCQGNEIQEKDLIVDDSGAHDEFEKAQSGEYPSLKEIEKKYIAFVLKKTGWKKERAARILDIDRTTLYRKLNDYGFEENQADSSLPASASLFS